MVPRYRYKMEVTVCHNGGTSFAARTSDVSQHGMGLQLGREVVVALAQGGSVLTPGDRFEVVLSPHIASADGVIGPTLLARVRHVRRLSQSDYHVGVWFNDPDASQQAALQAIIDKAQPGRSR